MVFGLGSHDSKDREELDQNYYKRRKIYLEAKEKERENMARQRGIEDARAIANKKPFYKKVLGAAEWIGKDLATGNPSQILGSSPQRQRSTRHRSTSKKQRKTKRRRKSNGGNGFFNPKKFPLL